MIADLDVTGKFAYIAARLLDVNPATNTETLVARGDYRIDPNRPDGLQAFQLPPGAWHFAAGHVPELELLGRTRHTAPLQRHLLDRGLEPTAAAARHEIPDTPGTPAVVKTPLPAVTSNTPPCARPTAAISPNGSHASRMRLTVTGTAAEFPCAQASAATQRAEHVTHVYVTVSTSAPHHRCAFLTAKGKLSAPRACDKPNELLARGTTNWQLRVKVHLAARRYLVKSQAVDDRHTRGRLSAITLVVRR